MPFFKISKDKESIYNKVNNSSALVKNCPSLYLNDKDYRNKNLVDNYKTKLKCNIDTIDLKSKNYVNHEYKDDYKKRNRENQKPYCYGKHRSQSKDRNSIRKRKRSTSTKHRTIISEKRMRKNDNYKDVSDQKNLTERNDLNFVDTSEFSVEDKPFINDIFFKSLDFKNSKSDAEMESIRNCIFKFTSDSSQINSLRDINLCESVIFRPNNMPSKSLIKLESFSNFCPFDYNYIVKPEKMEQYFKIIDYKLCVVNYLTQLLSISELSPEVESSYSNEVTLSQKENFGSKTIWKLEPLEIFSLSGRVNSSNESDPRVVKTIKSKF